MRAGRWWSLLVFMLAGLPLAGLILTAVMGALGVDPAKHVVDWLGHSAYGLLLLTLCMTPLRKISGWVGWLRVRRQLGLWSFFYASIHALAFLALIIGWDWGRLLTEVEKRPYVLVGMLALVGLLILALTSNRYSIRKLGSAWGRLHRLVYLIVVLAVVHYFWLVRSDIALWAAYAIGVVLLLGYRAAPLFGRFVSVRG